MDGDETEFVVAGAPNSVRYASLGLVSLCLCSFTGLIIYEATNSSFICAVSGHLVNQIVPKFTGGSTADLFIKAYNSYIEKSAEEMADEGISLTF